MSVKDRWSEWEQHLTFNNCKRAIARHIARHIARQLLAKARLLRSFMNHLRPTRWTQHCSFWRRNPGHSLRNAALLNVWGAVRAASAASGRYKLDLAIFDIHTYTHIYIYIHNHNYIHFYIYIYIYITSHRRFSSMLAAYVPQLVVAIAAYQLRCHICSIAPKGTNGGAATGPFHIQYHQLSRVMGWEGRRIQWWVHLRGLKKESKDSDQRYLPSLHTGVFSSMLAAYVPQLLVVVQAIAAFQLHCHICSIAPGGTNGGATTRPLHIQYHQLSFPSSPSVDLIRLFHTQNKTYHVLGGIRAWEKIVALCSTSKE